MIFEQTTLPGVWHILPEPREDERGLFLRTYCEREFAEHGLQTHWPQSNLSLTRRRGTIRGLHFQAEPHPETKLIRCVAGAIWDVVVEVRPGSPTSGRWQAFELSAENGRQLYVPAGFAHGFQALTDDAQVLYQMSAVYRAELARGVRWNDPALAIAWPLAAPELSERDRALPRLAELL